ncbi:dTDP-4-dehydrorhamnose 3,5-epimerase [Halomonas halocynthiae]|uniref:dTDP-4-dehydrorhamnose 3,5-epimerase n=1 Tax=Halomonas halocynthiae TaxID=176290 RepID=UPI0004195801|nr:dTDP-4-dehydrorhamnose 3,5-epimerase [Halomonas halocynthiae]
MHITSLAIPDVLLITPKIFSDERGFFMESFNQRDFAAATGLDVTFVQDNHSRSKQGVLRGLHYQVKQPQGKLIRVTQGEVFDVAVDMREKSSTLGMWVSAVLSEKNNHQLWVPPGFAHGFYVLSEYASVQYKCTQYYRPSDESCVRWNDESLDISWPMNDREKVVVSKKDAGATGFHRAPRISIY